MNLHPTIPTALAVLAQSNPFAPLFATFAGIVAAAVAALMSAVVGIATLVLVISLIKAMTKKPTWEKLAALVAIMCFAVMLAGASPGLLRASFTWGKTLGDGTSVGTTSVSVDPGTGQ